MIERGPDISCGATGARTAMQAMQGCNGTGCEHGDSQKSFRTELEKAERPVNTQYFK